MGLIDNIKAIFVKLDLDKNGELCQKEVSSSDYASIFTGYFKSGKPVSYAQFADVVGGDESLSKMFGAEFTKQPISADSSSQKQREVPFQKPSEIKLENMPKANDSFHWFVNWGNERRFYDLRGNDASGLDLSNRADLLNNFDNYTKFPSSDKLPQGYNPQEVLENGKNPGLGIEKLHELGYTGKGVNVAIIDTPMTINHDEFSENPPNYNEINVESDHPAEMHGMAVTSMLAGKNVGVAPEANVDYYGVRENSTDRLAALNQIIEKNDSLPEDKKTKVVSMSWGVAPDDANYQKFQDTVKKLEASGVFVIYSQEPYPHDFAFGSVKKDSSANPDLASSYKLGDFVTKQMGEENYANRYGGNVLLVPSDNRTLAGPSGKDNYVNYENGGSSWQTPYIAGLYTLAKQANPNLTPDEFRKLSMETGTPYYTQGGKLAGKIINPEKLIETVKQ